MGRTAIAIGCALVPLAACRGEVTSVPQRATSDGVSDAPSAPQGMGDGGRVDGAPVGTAVAPPSGGAGASVFPGCRRAASLDDAGAGVQACFVGRALVQCLDDGGAGCQWVSDGSTSCGLDGPYGPNGYGPANGFACQNLCGPDEYAAACGGLPGQELQQAPPPECRHAGRVLEEFETFCCPCE
jgi:hypothetical protein